MVATIAFTNVHLWDMHVGVVSWDAERELGLFEFTPEYIRTGLDISPLHMPVHQAGVGRIYEYGLNRETFHGLPGLLADSLPDRFGHDLIQSWLHAQHRTWQDFSPIEHLSYVGSRGMGALEFRPATGKMDRVENVDLPRMVALINSVNKQRHSLRGKFGDDETTNVETLQEILRIGSSAGGARAKAVVAINQDGVVMSGQANAPEGFEHYLLKFDGIEKGDSVMADSTGFGRIEYAYYLMAEAADIIMMPSRLLEENGRAHFITKRFDRHGSNKIHSQTLCGLAHFDFNQPGAHSFEQAFGVMRTLRLSQAQAVELYRRIVFNIISRNQDDHPKNISFLMDRQGNWSLAPAYDVTYSYDPNGKWTATHQMSLAGKRDNFTRKDLIEAGKAISIQQPGDIIDKTVEVVSRWNYYAKVASVMPAHVSAIAKTHRLYLGEKH